MFVVFTAHAGRPPGVSSDIGTLVALLGPAGDENVGVDDADGKAVAEEADDDVAKAEPINTRGAAGGVGVVDDDPVNVVNADPADCAGDGTATVLASISMGVDDTVAGLVWVFSLGISVKSCCVNSCNGCISWSVKIPFLTIGCRSS